jgi:hypothetical protein
MVFASFRRAHFGLLSGFRMKKQANRSAATIQHKFLPFHSNIPHPTTACALHGRRAGAINPLLAEEAVFILQACLSGAVDLAAVFLCD